MFSMQGSILVQNNDNPERELKPPNSQLRGVEAALT